jgi:hypothetical protein
MHFIHGLLSWFSGHCWGCRLGAKWRQRSEPASANPAFMSPAFLWFAFVLTLLDGVTVGLVSSASHRSISTVIAVSSVVAGLATGLVHGREPYSSF